MADVLGTFEQAVLVALVRPSTALGKEGYGRAVWKEVQLRLDRPVSAGAVYATLDRLEQKGLISSEIRAGDDARGGRGCSGLSGGTATGAGIEFSSR